MQSYGQKCLFLAIIPNIGQKWLKYLHQDLRKSWFASNKLLMICMVAILLNDTKFSNFNAKNNLFDYNLWPKNAILCQTTYNLPEEGKIMWLCNINEAVNLMQSSGQKCLFLAGIPKIGQNWLKYLHQDKLFIKIHLAEVGKKHYISFYVYMSLAYELTWFWNVQILVDE